MAVFLRFRSSIIKICSASTITAVRRKAFPGDQNSALRRIQARPADNQTSSIVEDSNTDALREVTCRDDLCFPMTMAAIVGRGRGRGCLGRCGFRAAVLFHSVRMTRLFTT